MQKNKHESIVLYSKSESDTRKSFVELMKSSPLPEEEVLANLGLFISSKELSRILFFSEIYKKIIGTHGIICEFGVRWGQVMSLLSALRGIFEPFNRHRKIVGFDTFAGFKGMGTEDGESCKCSDGSFSVTDGYESYLESVLDIQENLNPIPHLRKFEIVKGDACETIPDYFSRHPESLVSLAIFDFDIYKPTRTALEQVKSRLFKGSVLIFDELCDDIFPGETIALNEVFNLQDLRIQRLPMTSRVSFAILE